MDLYILDEHLRRIEVVDQYESLIWTERYSAWGDFELVIRSTRGTRTLFSAGTRLAINESYRVMEVETVEDTTDSNGNKALKIKGRSLEAYLEQRITAKTWIAAGTAFGKLVFNETLPGDIARHLFDYYCRNNTDVPQDVFPFIEPGTLLPPGSIPEPVDPISIEWDVDTVYALLKKICDMYNLGFRIVRNGDTGELYFDVYTGHNRTSLQTVNPVVVFSPNLDNLSNTTQLTSVSQLKNVAYVMGKNGSRIVYGDGVEDTISGFDRRVLMVKADDIDLEAGSALDAALEQRGKEALAEHRVIIAFDGEIPQFGSYVYGVDYSLGDLVEQRNSDGLATNMRVTEQIFIADQQGFRSYPTLTINLLITPGSWYAWTAGQVWDDAEGYWYDH